MSEAYANTPITPGSRPGLATAVAARTEKAAARAASAKARGYIVGPFYDGLFFIFSPLLALGLGVLIFISHLPGKSVTLYLFDFESTLPGLFIGTFIMAHLFLVFFRSHGNRTIFSTFPLRFTLVPVALFALMCSSMWIAVIVTVLATWWDVYHSSLQTFGIGRIYDMRRGNDVTVGRRLDYMLNLLIYAGPILAGATLMLHTKSFEDFEHVRSIYFARFGQMIDAQQPMMTKIILGVGIPFMAYYLLSYWRYYKQGYKVSFQKVALLLSTAACSIYAWGFNGFGEAFFVMNFFHALQYFGIVWWSEKKNMVSMFRLSNVRGGVLLTVLLFVGITFAYGIWATAIDSGGMGTGINFGFNVVMVVAIMHFWYDSFIWSVRKKQV